MEPWGREIASAIKWGTVRSHIGSKKSRRDFENSAGKWVKSGTRIYYRIDVTSCTTLSVPGKAYLLVLPYLNAHRISVKSASFILSAEAMT